MLTLLSPLSNFEDRQKQHPIQHMEEPRWAFRLRCPTVLNPPALVLPPAVIPMTHENLLLENKCPFFPVVVRFQLSLLLLQLNFSQPHLKNEQIIKQK